MLISSSAADVFSFNVGCRPFRPLVVEGCGMRLGVVYRRVHGGFGVGKAVGGGFLCDPVL